tara:strand:- start:4525 stop:5079 length:555 start_codon:yes stop_codon:yes gene_type:complete
MRIIGGSLKGRIIKFFKTKKTRPLKDSVKENIFNILTHSDEIKVDLKNAIVLDLYSGIGSFGLECFSRGAQKVSFVEIDLEAIKVLEENLLKLSLRKQSEIINSKIENIQNWKKKYNIFFLDPPFKDLKFVENLREIKNRKIFKKNHLIIIHREKNSNDDFKDILKIFKIKTYGRSKIIFAFFK